MNKVPPPSRVYVDLDPNICTKEVPMAQRYIRNVHSKRFVLKNNHIDDKTHINGKAPDIKILTWNISTLFNDETSPFIQNLINKYLSLGYVIFFAGNTPIGVS